MSKLYRNVSDLREKIVSKRKTCENLSISSRRSSANYEAPSSYKEIPKTTSELLKRYGSSRVKIPSYKQDAVSLISSIISKPLKRIFLNLKKNSKLFMKNSKKSRLLIENEKFVIQTFEKNQLTKLKNKKYLTKGQLFKGIQKIFSVFSNNSKKLQSFALTSMFFFVRKKVGAESILKGIIFKLKQVLKKSFKTIKRCEMTENYSVQTTKVLPIPPLNLEKQVFSPYFPQVLKKEPVNISRVLSSNVSRDSKRSNILTDRRSDKLFNPSTLPSSIYSDSENSVTERTEFKNSKRKTIQLKDIENFFDLDSIQDLKKPAQKVNFFKQQEKIRKNYSKTLEKFAGNYELFALEKIMKQFIEKVMIKGFYKWKFGVKKKKNEGNCKKISDRPLSKGSKTLKYAFERGSLKRLQKMKQRAPKGKILKMIKNFAKDLKYRVKVCFNHWKQESAAYTLMSLKVLSFLQNFKLLSDMRCSWVFNTFKRFTKNPLFNY